MKDNKKGYWIYSIITVIVAFSLVAFLGYLIYDLILKLAEKDLTNNTIIQALITLVITIFIGGYFSKWLERRNDKKIEVFKIQRDISVKIIDLITALYYHPERDDLLELLIAESEKVKLYFNDEVLSSINDFATAAKESATKEERKQKCDDVVTKLKKVVR